MDGERGVVVIDLGLERGEPPSYTNPRRSTVPAWFPPALLALLILLCSAASAAPPKSPLSTVFSLPVGPADAYALTADGQLLAQTFGMLTAYDVATGQLRWQSGQSTPAFRLRLSDGLVLIRPWSNGMGDPGTVAISTATGLVQWESPGSIVLLPGSSTLLAVSTVRSLGGQGRRVQGPVQAIDPLTGRNRWTVEVPSTAVLLGVPGPSDEGIRMLLVHDDNTFAVHDLDTGRLLTRARIPAADYNPNNPAVAGGLILLRHPGSRGSDVTAYDPVTLRPLWTGPGSDAYTIQPCGMLACLIGPAGIRAINPTTGSQRWSRPHWGAVQQQGAMFVAYGEPDGTEPAAIIDPDTGDVHVALDGWRPVSGSDWGDSLLLTRPVDAGARTMVAVARPAEHRLQLLATLPTGTGDCQAVPGRLVCRSIYGELVVWAYRPKG